MLRLVRHPTEGLWIDHVDKTGKWQDDPAALQDIWPISNHQEDKDESLRGNWTPSRRRRPGGSTRSTSLRRSLAEALTRSLPGWNGRMMHASRTRRAIRPTHE